MYICHTGSKKIVLCHVSCCKLLCHKPIIHPYLFHGQVRRLIWLCVCVCLMWMCVYLYAHLNANFSNKFQHTKQADNPAPGAYAAEKAPTLTKRAPAYTIVSTFYHLYVCVCVCVVCLFLLSPLRPYHHLSQGARTEPRKVDQTPGPTAYSLPTTVGGTKASSMAGKPSFLFFFFWVYPY